MKLQIDRYKQLKIHKILNEQGSKINIQPTHFWNMVYFPGILAHFPSQTQADSFSVLVISIYISFVETTSWNN